VPRGRSTAARKPERQCPHETQHEASFDHAITITRHGCRFAGGLRRANESRKVSPMAPFYEKATLTADGEFEAGRNVVMVA
jgi:hypothetical protein